MNRAQGAVQRTHERWVTLSVEDREYFLGEVMSEKPERWKRVKMGKGGGVHINIKKKTIMYNPKQNWIRFESPYIIHIY